CFMSVLSGLQALASTSGVDSCRESLARSPIQVNLPFWATRPDQPRVCVLEEDLLESSAPHMKRRLDMAAN
ncbi:hypothetical protein, partial [Ottowia flava]|uniref:hypothetical protein n=1 Tax=Ottowia sp. GY511 TaxID=2603274 RepID=UPI001C9D1AB2